MRFQIGALVEAAIAHLALVRRLLQVERFVDGQCARLAEAFAAFGALEWFFLRMNVSERRR